jgi:hypothetical protein
VAAVLSAEFAFVAKRQQGVDARIGYEIHIPAAPAISAIGAATGNILFTAKGGSAIAARPGFYENSCLIVEFTSHSNKRYVLQNDAASKKRQRGEICISPRLTQ